MHFSQYDKNMNLNRLILFFVFTSSLLSCADYKTQKSGQDTEKMLYYSKGFALVYNESLYKKKIINKRLNNEKIVTMHSVLKANTLVKIINPINLKFVETKISKRANYPKIFNIVLSKRAATILDLDVDNPYVEILEVKKNKKFIAKKSNIFDEEKNVAATAPVDEIKMDDLTKEKIKDKKKIDKRNFILVISDFYYEDSANNLMTELIKKIKIDNISVKIINGQKYRLFVGPFKNFNALKNTYISLNNLGFEDLNIYSE